MDPLFATDPNTGRKWCLQSNTLLGGTVDAIAWRAVSGRNNRGHFENAGVHDVYIKRALLPQVYSGFYIRKLAGRKSMLLFSHCQLHHYYISGVPINNLQYEASSDQQD